MSYGDRYSRPAPYAQRHGTQSKAERAVTRDRHDSAPSGFVTPLWTSPPAGDRYDSRANPVEPLNAAVRKAGSLVRTIGTRRRGTTGTSRGRQLHPPTNRARPVLGNLTTNDLASIVSLACYVTPRSDEEQLVLLKAAVELDNETGSTLGDEVRASAGAPQRDLQLPSANVAKALALGGAVAAAWRVLARARSRRRRRA